MRERTLYRLGLALSSADKHDEMLETFSTLLEKYPRSGHAAEATYRIAKVLLEKGNYAGAIERYEQVVAEHRESDYYRDALQELAYAYHQAEKDDKAATTFIKLIDVDANVELPSETLVWLGSHLYATGRYKDSLKASSAFKTENATPRDRELVGLKIAQCHLKLKDYKAAREGFESLLKSFPNGFSTAESHYGMGLCQTEEADEPGALQSFEQAVKNDEGEVAARALFEIGTIHMNAKNYQDACEAFLRVGITFQHPDLSPASFLRAGDALRLDGKLVDAQERYREVIRDYPETIYATEAEQRLKELAPPR